jgi:hypothetical protein
MSTQDIVTIANNLKEHIESQVNSARELVLGNDVILKRGKFKGRKARITGVSCDYKGMVFLAQPYRLDGRVVGEWHGDLLWDHPDARSYWDVSDLDWSLPDDDTA